MRRRPASLTPAFCLLFPFWVFCSLFASSPASHVPGGRFAVITSAATPAPADGLLSPLSVRRTALCEGGRGGGWSLGPGRSAPLPASSSQQRRASARPLASPPLPASPPPAARHAPPTPLAPSPPSFAWRAEHQSAAAACLTCKKPATQRARGPGHHVLLLSFGF